MTASPIAASFRCARCGEVAATVTLLPPGVANPAVAAAGLPSSAAFEELWRLSIDGGPVPMSVGPVRKPRRVAAALAVADLEGLADIDVEYANFRCPTCASAYCRAHWSAVVPEWDDGFYDATYGTCPRGHRVMLDD